METSEGFPGRFRAALASTNRGRSRPGWRVPPALKLLAVRYAEAELAKGRKRSPVAEELGIGSETLRGWIDRQGRSGFREV